MTSLDDDCMTSNPTAAVRRLCPHSVCKLSQFLLSPSAVSSLTYGSLPYIERSYPLIGLTKQLAINYMFALRSPQIRHPSSRRLRIISANAYFEAFDAVHTLLTWTAAQRVRVGKARVRSKRKSGQVDDGTGCVGRDA